MISDLPWDLSSSYAQVQIDKCRALPENGRAQFSAARVIDKWGPEWRTSLWKQRQAVDLSSWWSKQPMLSGRYGRWRCLLPRSPPQGAWRAPKQEEKKQKEAWEEVNKTGRESSSLRSPFLWPASKLPSPNPAGEAVARAVEESLGRFPSVHHRWH